MISYLRLRVFGLPLQDFGIHFANLVEARNTESELQGRTQETQSERRRIHALSVRTYALFPWINDEADF